MGKGIKTGGGAENLKEELSTQDVLITNIAERIIGKSNGATATEDTILDGFTAYVGQKLITGKYLPHGNYVWKKGFNVPDEIVNLQFSWLSNNQVQLNRTGVPLTDLIGWEFIYGVTITNDLFFYDRFDETSYGYSYDEGSGILKSNSLDYFNTKKSATYNKKRYTFPGYFTVEEYVVSNDATKYPNGGMQDGYWYELMEDSGFTPALFGCTKFAVDTFSYDANTAINIKRNITHSLGEKPKIAFVHGKPSFNMSEYVVYEAMVYQIPENNNAYVQFYTKHMGNTVAQFNSNLTGNVLTSAVVSIQSSNTIYFESGIQYTLVTMA
jgi:hypothetical protein